VPGRDPVTPALLCDWNDSRGSESVTRGLQFDVQVLQTTRHISQWNPRYRLKQVNIDL